MTDKYFIYDKQGFKANEIGKVFNTEKEARKAIIKQRKQEIKEIKKQKGKI